MDQQHLEELIAEVQERGGGLILNVHDRPEVVVLSIERYNALLSQQSESGELSALLDQLDKTSERRTRKILVTGGAGYIGGNMVRELQRAGYQVIVLDNLSTGRRQQVPADTVFIEGDCGDRNLLRDVFGSNEIYAVIHMAASLEVEESVREPAKYLRNNVVATATLLEVMAEYNVKKFIFSSTGAVYGQQDIVPIPEVAKTAPQNPYGYSKLLAERLVKYHSHFLHLQAVIFRYFNVCGADLEAQISSSHTSHVLPIILDTAAGKRSSMVINGDDYETHDGTCVRDYVHVLDIVRAHLLALEQMDEVSGCRIYNIGTGRGLSVKELVNTAAEVTGRMIPLEVGPRRAGDVPIVVADNQKIKQELGFVPLFSEPETIISTAWQQVQQQFVVKS